MANYEEQPQDGQEQSRRSFQQYPQRSTASGNWRTKDELPRADPQPRQSRPYGSGRGGGYGGQQRESSDTRLYVGNLLYSAQRDDIAQFFNDNGFNVANISMSIDPLTGKNPSYCFVDFDSSEDASRAMAELNGQDVLGRAVRINPGVAKRNDGSRGDRVDGQALAQEVRGEGQNFRQNRGWGADQPRETARNFGGFPRSDRGDRAPGFNRNNSQDVGPTKRLYIGNLPNIEGQQAVGEAIQSLFDPLGIEVASIGNIIQPHESKRELPGDHHFLFVELAKYDDVDRAIEELDGKPTPWSAEIVLRVNKAREQSARRGGREEGQGGYRGGYQGRRTEGQRDWRTSQGYDQ